MRKITIIVTVLVNVLFCNSFLRAQVPTNGLIGYWPFNGNANDESTYSNNGGLGLATLTEDKDGNLNSAIGFDGVDDQMSINSNSIYNQLRSISFWFKPSSHMDSSNSVSSGLVNGATMKTDYDGFQIYIYGSSNVNDIDNGRIIIEDIPVSGSKTNIKSNANNWIANTWYHIVVVLDGMGKVYVNGEDNTYSSTLTKSEFTNLSAGHPIYFGFLYKGSVVNYFNGALDEITYHNRELIESEILGLSSHGTADTIITEGFWSQKGSNIFYSDGNIGIGTDDPTSTLEIKNEGRALEFSRDGYDTWAIHQTSAIGRGTGASGYGFGIYNETDGKFRIAFSGDGSTGIGTTKPIATLDIVGPPNGNSYYNFPTLKVSSGATSGTVAMCLETISDNPTNLVFRNNGKGRVWLSSRNSDENYAFRIYTNPGGTRHPEKLAMNIEQNGNIGIGTTSPAAKFHLVQDNENYDSGIKIAGSSSPISGRIWMEGEKLHIQNDTAGTETGFTLDKSGKVGVGTTSPLEKLEIKNGSLRITNLTYSAYGSLGKLDFFNSNPSSGPFAAARIEGKRDSYNDKDGRLSFYTSNVNGALIEHMTIDRTGNVGIGTTNPIYKLAVKGTIGCSEIKIENTTGWPDFVFEPNYNLRTLNELKTYIQENKHLPEIPTTAEVEENGISVGDMNAKLLQKIEELTLYTIEQQELIESLVNRIEKIENK